MRAMAGYSRADEAIRARSRRLTETFVEFPRDEVEGSIAERFEAQARTFPDRVAVRTRSETLTYEELNRAANRIAHAVLEHRGEGEGLVGLLFDTGAAHIAASLGTVKAGATQVPLDSAFPIARLAYMVEQSGTRLILTDERGIALARELAGPERVVLDVAAVDGPALPGNPGLRLGPDTYAAVEYTSGSTGHPKGILRDHRGTLHDVLRHTSMSRLCPADRMVMPGRGIVTHLHALLNGAAFYPVDRRPEALSRLADWLIEERITVYRSAVSAFRTFVGALTGAERFPDLRLIELFGEPVYERDVEIYREHFPEDCLLVSTLGTSEFGDFAHCFVDRRAALPGGVVPGGYPAQDIEVLLLDEDGRPVRGADGMGEIAIRSRYGAAGYWRMPELTEATFGPAAGDGRRTYRTGDLGRFAPDGCLFHLGRRDFQVKVNGNRVHVSEVEAALLEHGAVRAAAVVGREEAPGSVRLVAYIVPAGPVPPTSSALRRAVASRLPGYMVPALFVTLDALPRTTTGKIDRRALPPPDGMRPALDTAYLAPRTPVEIALAAIWAEVLRVDRVGVQDSFFELGGDSLMATQVASRVLEQYALLLPPGALLEAGTVADMAGVILAGLAASGDAHGLATVLDALETSPLPRGADANGGRLRTR